MPTDYNSNTRSTKEEKVTVLLTDASPNVVANFHGQARNQSFTLGLSASTYRPNINLFVLLTQYGTLCQARISCLESYYQRGKTPRVYEFATWQHSVVGSFCSLFGR